jgi:replicative DNA helicase
MSQASAENLRNSRGLRLVTEQGWNYRGPSGGQIQIETCPFCHKSDYKFYMAVANTDESTRDSLYFCHHASCAATGNLRTLQEHLGIRIPGIDSRKEWAGGPSKPDELPDPDECHRALIGDAEAMDYLLNVRGFTREIIDRQKLGLKEKVYFRKAGETKALVIPYLSLEGNITFAKYCTMPPNEKDFACPSGWEAGLFNAGVLTEGCQEIIFLEGEKDVLSAMSNGIENAVGVPGANVKKNSWIETLDRIAPEKIYLCYDGDKVGNKAAQEMASKIGIDKCLKIILPAGVKDINEFFVNGGTLEQFEKLKASATMFEITGVTSAKDALSQLEDELSGKHDLAPKYVSPWKELNSKVGFEDGDVCDILGPSKRGKTTFSLNLADHFAASYGENVLVCCLEMSPARLAKKWVSLVTGFEDNITEPGTEESRQKLAELKLAVVDAKEIQRNREGDIYFAYPLLVRDPEDVFKLMRDCIRRYGVKTIVLDNIQLLCDLTLKNAGLRAVHLSQISKVSAKIAKDYGIKLFRILQPKKLDEANIINSNDTEGSSHIEKDCDALLILWRKSLSSDLKLGEYDQEADAMKESDTSFDSKMRVDVALSRYSSGGSCFLYFDGARSQVRSYDEIQKAELKARNFNGIVVQNGVPTEADNETVSI